MIIHKSIKKFLTDKAQPPPFNRIQKWKTVRNKPIVASRKIFSINKVRETTLHIKRLLKPPNIIKRRNFNRLPDPIQEGILDYGQIGAGRNGRTIDLQTYKLES